MNQHHQPKIEAILLSRAEIAMAQASSLSENKLKPDSMTLALFYELKGEPERAASRTGIISAKESATQKPGAATE